MLYCRHTDFVTALDFHPVDDKYFLSGSIDGKVSCWSSPDFELLDNAFTSHHGLRKGGQQLFLQHDWAITPKADGAFVQKICRGSRKAKHPSDRHGGFVIGDRVCPLVAVRLSPSISSGRAWVQACNWPQRYSLGESKFARGAVPGRSRLPQMARPPLQGRWISWRCALRHAARHQYACATGHYEYGQVGLETPVAILFNAKCLSHPAQPAGTMRFGSTAKVLAKCMLKYYRISEWLGSQLLCAHLQVRCWNIPDQKVVDWADVHEMVTAAAFSSEGSRAVVGTMRGKCRFYQVDTNFRLDYQAQIGGNSCSSRWPALPDPL